MVGKVEIRISPELERFFREGAEDAEKQSELALQELGVLGESKAKPITPVITNRLRSSIHWENHRSQGFHYRDNKGNTFDGRFADKPARGEVVVGTNVDYALEVEGRHGFMKRTSEYLVKIALEIFSKHIKP